MNSLIGFDPFPNLPTLKQQFIAECYEPVARELPANMPLRFEAARERYEQLHGHQFPYGYDAFCKAYYGR